MTPSAFEVFDFQKLKEVTKVVTRNLNRVIDRCLWHRRDLFFLVSPPLVSFASKKDKLCQGEELFFGRAGQPKVFRGFLGGLVGFSGLKLGRKKIVFGGFGMVLLGFFLRKQSAHKPQELLSIGGGETFQPAASPDRTRGAGIGRCLLDDVLLAPAVFWLICLFLFSLFFVWCFLGFRLSWIFCLTFLRFGMFMFF